MHTPQKTLRLHAEECLRRAGLATDPLIRLDFLNLASHWLDLAATSQEMETWRERLGRSNRISSGKVLQETLFKFQAWRRCQAKALKFTMLGARLDVALGVLTRTASEFIGDGARTAFYIADSAGTTLHHVVGMPAAYAEAVDGFKIGADSLACGLATHTGKAVLTADVAADARWEPWRRMADKFDYRGCWSFPIIASVRRGSFAVYSSDPRTASSADLEFAELVTLTAAILITQHACRATPQWGC